MSLSITKQLAITLLELSDGKNENETKEVVKDFAAYLAKKNLIAQADEILDEYRTLYNKKHGIVEATVTMMGRLSDKKRLEIREAIKKKHKAREVHILDKIDERILGGMKVKVGDVVYDGTLKSALKELEAALLR